MLSYPWFTHKDLTDVFRYGGPVLLELFLFSFTHEIIPHMLLDREVVILMLCVVLQHMRVRVVAAIFETYGAKPTIAIFVGTVKSSTILVVNKPLAASWAAQLMIFSEICRGGDPHQTSFWPQRPRPSISFSACFLPSAVASRCFLSGHFCAILSMTQQ